jgi:hypothetical protein
MRTPHERTIRGGCEDKNKINLKEYGENFSPAFSPDQLISQEHNIWFQNFISVISW